MKPLALLQRSAEHDALDCPVGGLALYDTTRLSIPDSAVESTSLAQLLTEDTRDYVCRWSELMLHSENEQRFVHTTSEPPRLYQDPILACSRMVVRFARTPRYHCTFFLHKKQGRQRFIVDARDVNRHFRRPPAAALASPEAVAGLVCNEGNSFWISTFDVRDAWARWGAPERQ